MLIRFHSKRIRRHIRRIAFSHIDPLGGGISEEIRRMQNDPNSAIDLFDRPTGEELQAYLKNLMAVEVESTMPLGFDTQEV